MENQEEIMTLNYAPVRNKSKLKRNILIILAGLSLTATPFAYSYVSKKLHTPQQVSSCGYDHSEEDTPEHIRGSIKHRAYYSAYNAAYKSIIESYMTQNYTIDKTNFISLLIPDEKFKRNAEIRAAEIAKDQMEMLLDKNFLDWAIKSN